MTWSLKLANGDLVKGPGNKLGIITGADKVVQDLKLWLLTDLGTNPLAPNYGSLIDAPPNTFVEFATGDTYFVSEDRLDLILNEIQRIMDEYQRRQYIRLEEEVNLYDGRHTFTEGEIISDYDIEYELIADTLYIDVIIYTLDGSTSTLELPVSR